MCASDEPRIRILIIIGVYLPLCLYVLNETLKCCWRTWMKTAGEGEDIAVPAMNKYGKPKEKNTIPPLSSHLAMCSTLFSLFSVFYCEFSFVLDVLSRFGKCILNVIHRNAHTSSTRMFFASARFSSRFFSSLSFVFGLQTTSATTPKFRRKKKCDFLV